MENQLIDILINSDSIAIVICGYMLIRLEQLTKKLNKLDLELSLVKAKVCKKWTLVISAVLIIMSHTVIYVLMELKLLKYCLNEHDLSFK